MSLLSVRAHVVELAPHEFVVETQRIRAAAAKAATVHIAELAQIAKTRSISMGEQILVGATSRNAPSIIARPEHPLGGKVHTPDRQEGEREKLYGEERLSVFPIPSSLSICCDSDHDKEAGDVQRR